MDPWPEAAYDALIIGGRASLTLSLYELLRAPDGGGISGLGCAVRLLRAGKRVALLERQPRLGGRLCSCKAWEW